jgi:hypothetical protein
VLFGFFTKTYNSINNANVKILSIRESLSITTSGTGTYTFIDNRPTINQTGGSASFIGYDYNPTLTSITGAHYGLLIRPNTLNGFGLGTTLPTATLQVKGADTTTGSSLIVQNSSNFTNLQVFNSNAASVKIGENGGIQTTISGGSSGTTDYILRVLRGAAGISIKATTGNPAVSTIESTSNMQLFSNDNSLITIGSANLLRSQIINISQTYSALGTGYGFALGSNRSEIRFGDSKDGGVGNVPYLMQVVSNNRTEPASLKINPFGGNVGIGLSAPHTIVPQATLHVKSASDVTGTILKIDSNTEERFRVDSDGNIFSNGLHMFGGSGDTPQSKVDISAPFGYDQLTLRTPYTPSSTGDPNGNIGTVIWDDDFVYVKTLAGWKKSPLIAI